MKDKDVGVTLKVQSNKSNDPPKTFKMKLKNTIKKTLNPLTNIIGNAKKITKSLKSRPPPPNQHYTFFPVLSNNKKKCRNHVLTKGSDLIQDLINIPAQIQLI